MTIFRTSLVAFAMACRRWSKVGRGDPLVLSQHWGEAPFPHVAFDPVSDHELQAAYDHILEQFALELLIGAHENSDWSNPD